MENLTKDVLFNIATMLDLDELLSFCSSNSRINNLVCKDRTIWNFKLMKEFPDYKSHINQRGKEAYELLVSLNKLKKEFKYQGTIYQLYKETNLYLFNNKIEILSPEIGKLSNLRTLWLNNNQIKTLPPEIGNLSNLEILWLRVNQIKTLPPEIGNLSHLEYLFLDYNKIEILPPEIGKLKNLEELYLTNNQIKTLPPEIGKLRQLRELWLDKNVIVPTGLKLFITYR